METVVNWTRVATMEVMGNGQIWNILQANQDLQINWRWSLSRRKLLARALGLKSFLTNGNDGI